LFVVFVWTISVLHWQVQVPQQHFVALDYITTPYKVHSNFDGRKLSKIKYLKVAQRSGEVYLKSGGSCHTLTLLEKWLKCQLSNQPMLLLLGFLSTPGGAPPSSTLAYYLNWCGFWS
jgi:hypothetical protein